MPLYDEEAVTVETFTRELTLSDETDVRAYVEIFDGLQTTAVFGETARMHSADDCGVIASRLR